MKPSVGGRVRRAVVPGATGFARLLPQLARFVNARPWARRLVSNIVVEVTSSACPPRPHRLSLWSPSEPGSTPEWVKPTADADKAAEAVREHAFVSWPSLTDRRFTARHLPPAPRRQLPSADALVDLFERPGKTMRKSTQNSALLGFFAQWFTDSFLRTDREDLRRNTSNHEIDFCQIYGLNEERTRALRSGRDGRLASRETPHGEYPTLLLDPGSPPDPLIMLGMQRSGLGPEEIAARLPHLYSTGLERGNGNIGYTAMSTLFLREHNRLAAEIRREHAGWSDDRIFEAARNTVIAIGLKLVIEEYIVQLAQTPFRLVINPEFAARRRWYRTNRIAIEFNLLYRWHSMVPDEVTVGPRRIPFHDLQFNNAELEAIGLETLVDQLSRQPAGYIGLRNVPHFLRPAEEAAHHLARSFALAPMNDYRLHFGLKPIRSFEQLTDDADIRESLRKLYNDNIDAVEFLPGLFAEEERNDASFGSLLMRMVGYDAFTQALTNPLLAPAVFQPDTFSTVGWEAIQKTSSLDDVFQRNTAAGGSRRASLALLPMSAAVPASPVASGAAVARSLEALDRA